MKRMLPLVLEDQDGAGFCDGEVDAADSHVGARKAGAQPSAGVRSHDLRVIGGGHARLLDEQLGDLLLRLVNRRDDDVRRHLVGELNDPLPEVGLEDGEPSFLEGRVETDLLGGHALGFDHGLGVTSASDLQHNAARVLDVGSPVHRRACLLGLGGELLEVAVEVEQRLVLDDSRALA